MNTTAKKMILSHADTDFTAVFARKVDVVFTGEVSVLPNVDVLNEIRRQSRRRDVELYVLADNDGLYTIYRAGRASLFIDAYDNTTTDLDDIIMDDDTRGEFIDSHPELGGLIAQLYSDWCGQ